MVLLETAVLEESHLARFFLEVRRHGLAEFFYALFPGQGIPIRCSFLEGELDSRVGYAALREVEANPDRAFALVDAGLDEAVGETLVALQAIGSKLSHRQMGNIAIVAFVSQFPDQLSLPIFAARQEVHGFLAGFKRRRKAIFLLVGEKIADFFM